MCGRISFKQYIINDRCNQEVYTNTYCIDQQRNKDTGLDICSNNKHIGFNCCTKGEKISCNEIKISAFGTVTTSRAQ